MDVPTDRLCPDHSDQSSANQASIGQAVPTESNMISTTTIPGFDWVKPPREQALARPNFDPVSYLGQLEDMEISEDEKIALLTMLWDMMSRFVELGFGVDSMSIMADAAPLQDQDQPCKE